MRNKGKLLVIVFVSLSCVMSFALGAFVFQRGWHRPVLYPILDLFYSRVGFSCNTRMVNGICPGQSKWKLKPYEEELINQIDASVPEFPARLMNDFEPLLKEAVGWDAFRLFAEQGTGGAITTEKLEPFESGVLETHFIKYSIPKLKVRYFHAQHPTEQVIIILHGHNSSAHKVLGLDYADYMRQAGEKWFKHGYDIIAFDLTTNSKRSAYLNSQLLLYGGQIFGLWSRAVCDSVRISKIDQEYQKVFLYGLSNGGEIANHISVLCGELFDKIIIDDALEDWRWSAWKHPSLWGPQNYAIFYLSPLHAQSSYLDFAMNSKSQKYYITRQKNIDYLFLNEELNSTLLKGVAHEQKLNFVKKELKSHVVELDLVMKILAEENDLTGYHVP